MLLVLLGAGCASYEIKVDAMKRPGPVNPELTSFKIENRNPTLAGDSLRYQELAKHIKTALSGHGMWEARDASSADMIIEVTCGMSEPKVTYDTIEVAVLERPSDTKRRDGTYGNSAVTVDANPTPETREAKDSMAFLDHDVPVVVREKHLSVSCHENKKNAEGTPSTDLWRVSVSIEDESKDLRDYLPVLASAMMEQIGRDTDGLVIDSLGKHDEAISFVKKGF